VNFESACAIAEDYNCLEDINQKELNRAFRGNLKTSDVIAKKFVGEFAIDTERFFSRSQAILQKLGVTFVDSKVQGIDRISGKMQISLSNNDIVKADRIVVAAGSYSGKVLPKGFSMVPLFHAVGTAMVLDSAPADYSSLNFVVRTPNRGGAQCGMHIVPRCAGKFYLGAGNYLSDNEPAHRVETIRYLINVCEDELFGKQIIYGAKAELLLGARPKSIDGFPIMGSCEEFPEVYVATGMYRIGLTIAPVVANEICQWLESEESSQKFSNWSPARDPHSYASIEVATQYYSESRISNLIEHGLLDPNNPNAVANKKMELEDIAKNLNAAIIKKRKLPEDYVVDPDMYAILAATRSQIP
jgi:hypothetical protein